MIGAASKPRLRDHHWCLRACPADHVTSRASIRWHVHGAGRSHERGVDPAEAVASVAYAPAPARTTSAVTRRTPPAATAVTRADGRSSTPSPSRRTSGPTANAAAARADGPPASTRRSTSAGTKSSGPSWRSRAPAPWPPGSTSAPMCSTAPSPPPRSGSGSARDRHDRSQAPVRPSTSSRTTSRWPLWRDVSSMMWRITQRRST